MNTGTPRTASLRDFLNVIFKRKYQMALFFIITVGVVAGITFSMEPTYKANAQILVKIGSRNVFTLPGATGESIDFRNRTHHINTEKEFLKSRFLAEKVLDNLGADNIYSREENIANNSPISDKNFFQRLDYKNLKELPEPTTFEVQVGKLQNNLSVKDIANTNIIQIGFTHSNPEIAAQVVNSYMDTYLDERLQLHRNAQSRTFFKDQSIELKNRLEEAEKRLEFFKNENNITVIDEQQRLLLQQISDLRVALNNTQSSVIETERRLALITKQLSQTPETIPQEEQTDHNEALIGRLEAKLVELQIEEKELLSKYTPQSRMVTNVRERIGIVENKIEEQESKIIQRSSVGVNVTHQRLKEELYRLEAELEALKVKNEMLTEQLADFQSEKETLNRMETRLNGLQQEVDLYRGNYKLYLAKLEASRIEDAMDNEKINDVISMNRALPPLKPISPNYKLNIMMGILIGGIGALLLAIIGEFMDDSLETPEDVEKILQLTVLTSIPDSARTKRLDYQKTDTMQSNLKIQFP